MVEKIYGTLELVKKDHTNYWKISGPQPVMMIRRIVPSSGLDETGFAMVPNNRSNIEYIEWLMMKYKLDIRSAKEWEKHINELYAWKEKIASTRTLNHVEPEKTFTANLYDFQKEGLDFLLKTEGHALIADEMGLGKTLQSLAYVCTDTNTFPVLVISPVVTLYNWKNEIEKWMKLKAKSGLFRGRELAPRVNIIRGGKQEPISQADFYILNYEILSKRIDDLKPLGIQTVIGDEIQNIRNMDTEKYKGMKAVSNFPTVKHVIGLSGTPIYNRGSEIWPIVDVIQSGVLGSWKEFVHTYCWVDQRDRAIVHEDMRQAIADKLRDGVVLRRKKIDVLKDLPSKIRYNEMLETDNIYYEKELEKLYNLSQEKKRLAKTKLEQFHAEQELERNERKLAGIAKVPFIVKFVKDMMDLEESVVVFCHHINIHEMLHSELYEFNPAKIIGTQTLQDRQNNIEKFQKGQTHLMIAGLRAGNVGINLTNASYVVHAELDWTPAIHQQAEDRLHRIGQKNTVFSYYLVGIGTLDERIAGVLATKKQEIDAIMSDKAEEENPENVKKVVNLIRERIKNKSPNAYTQNEQNQQTQGLLF